MIDPRKVILYVLSAIAITAYQSCLHAVSQQIQPQATYETAIGASTSDVSLVPFVSSVLTYRESIRLIHTDPRLVFEAPENSPGFVDLLTNKIADGRRFYTGSTSTEFSGLREQEKISSVPRTIRALSAEISLSASAAQTGLGFDVGVSPRLTIARDGSFATRRFGGEVRIGQNFDQRGNGGPNGSWYLFAGADGEALVWEPDETGVVSVSDVALRDQVTVGDLQAGVSFQRGSGQISVSYIRREVEYRERNLSASEDEEFAGISFTIRR